MIKKFISRKLFAVVIGTILGVVYPPMIPFFTKLITAYVIAQGAVDTAYAFKNGQQ